MPPPEKFLFDTSFEPAAEARAKAKPRPKYFDEDLARARAEGVAEGRDAGTREALSGIEQSIARSLDALAQQLPALRQTQIDACQAQSADALRAAVAVARKILPNLARRDGLAEIEALVRDSLERLRDEPRIVVRVADALLDPVRDRVSAAAAQAGYDGKIVFLAQDSLQPGDVRVEWADGGIERDSARLWREIDATIQRLVGPPVHAAPVHAAPGPARATNTEPAAEAAPPAPAAATA